ncbi:MAG: hypothetical protein M3N93_14730 [Acidobacteriota bacterium]|nr:hypothetical protein [Acidobacteriota bacterium]
MASTDLQAPGRLFEKRQAQKKASSSRPLWLMFCFPESEAVNYFFFFGAAFFFAAAFLVAFFID